MWARLGSAALGIWLMLAPAVLGYGGDARTHDRIVGPLVTAFAIVAIWEVMRPLRRVNQGLGVWLLAAPWVLGYGLVGLLDSMIVGGLLIALAQVEGQVKGRFGGGWSALLDEGLLLRQRHDEGETAGPPAPTV